MQRILTYWTPIALAGMVSLGVTGSALADNSTMKVYLMGGQSNMAGAAFAYDVDFGGGAGTSPSQWNITTMEFLLGSSSASQAYLAAMPDSTYTFKQTFDNSWFEGRPDVWGVQYRSDNGQIQRVERTLDPNTNLPFPPSVPLPSIAPMSPGFGTGDAAEFGPEVGLGHRLGDAMQSPVFLFKSNRGGTNLTTNWRPPSAGGTTGNNYTNTVNRFSSFLDDLDNDLTDNGVLDDYNNATGYEVAGFIWLQGWNDLGTAEATYRELLVDLVEDIRASDSRIPNDLPAIIVESADQSATLNAARAGAVDTLNADNPGSAVFVETNDLRDADFGGLNSVGQPFSNGFDSHYNSRAENYLQVGWLMGDAILENGYTGSEIVPEPASVLLLGLGGLAPASPTTLMNGTVCLIGITP